MADDKSRPQTDAGASPPLIVKLGSAVELTGKQPRGHKEDGGAAGGDYKDASESPHE